MQSREFSETVNYFYDHLAENDVFLSNEVCYRTQSEKLAVLLPAAVGMFLQNPRPRLSEAIILHLRGTPFYHGSFRADRFLGTFFYFEDIEMGMLTLNTPGDPNTHFLRLGAQAVGGDSEPPLSL